MPVKLLLAYDILLDRQELYYNFVVNEFLPAVTNLGIRNTEVWHTAYGNYPLRLIVFVAEDAAHLNAVLRSDAWQELEERLQRYVTNYSRRVVNYEPRFQF